LGAAVFHRGFKNTVIKSAVKNSTTRKISDK